MSRDARSPNRHDDGPATANITDVGFTELHFHLLPGLDDGPETLEESVALARAAAAEGTRTIVATPHVNYGCVPDVSVLPELVAEVSAALARADVPVDVRCGGELAHDRVGRLTQSELETIAHGPRGRRWLLLEASLGGLDEDFSLAADELRDRGFGVVMAHPERSLGGAKAAWRIVEQELAASSGMQVNAWSIAGRYGETVQRDAERVIATAPVVAIASDAHGPARMPALGMALRALRDAGHRDAEHLVSAVPAALLRHGLHGHAALSAA